MPKDDNTDLTAAAQAARAARLRDQIKGLGKPGSEPDRADGATGAGSASRGESPNEFIQRRMRELDDRK